MSCKTCRTIAILPLLAVLAATAATTDNPQSLARKSYGIDPNGDQLASQLVAAPIRCDKGKSLAPDGRA